MRKEDSTLETVTGVTFFPFAPRPEDIVAEDIAHALSQNCRWGGHCDQFYSVAQHSFYVSLVAAREDPAAAAWGLLHDGAEGMGFTDLPTPIKRFLPEYAEAENLCQSAIRTRFAVPYNDDIMDIVHWADKYVLFAERNTLKRNASQRMRLEDPTIDKSQVLADIDPLFFCWAPHTAKREFLYRFGEVVG